LVTETQGCEQLP